jgi:hypothetical protein
MQAFELTESSFETYPPMAHGIAHEHLALLRELPVALAAILLRETIDLDEHFPAEQATILAQFRFLAGLTPEQRRSEIEGFARLSLTPELIAEDWARSPHKFEQALSAHLWASHQIDAFHAAGTQFAEAVRKANLTAKPLRPRWVVAILGDELRKDNYPLFRKLRRQGVFFPRTEAGGGTQAILDHLSARASSSPLPYGHWYVDGGSALPIENSDVFRFSWDGSAEIRKEILRKAQTVMGSGSAGPEALRSIMASWAAKEPRNTTGDARVQRFVMNVYGEGSGTQIFSTSFVQWSARELLRRAEPISLVARFGPRQRQRGMNEMFTDSSQPVEIDNAGSLVDADLATYYTWINLNRLEGSETSTFLAWSQAHRQAVAIGPGLPRGTEAPEATRMEGLLQMVAEG